MAEIGSAGVGTSGVSAAPDAAAARRTWLLAAGWTLALAAIALALAGWTQPDMVVNLFGQIYSCM